MDHLKGKCSRDSCKYFHPPQHLQVQIKTAQQRATVAAAAASVAAAAAAATVVTANGSKGNGSSIICQGGGGLGLVGSSNAPTPCSASANPAVTGASSSPIGATVQSMISVAGGGGNTTHIALSAANHVAATVPHPSTPHGTSTAVAAAQVALVAAAAASHGTSMVGYLYGLHMLSMHATYALSFACLPVY